MTAPERNLPPDAQAWGRYIEKRIAELSKVAGLASTTARAATARTGGAARAAAAVEDAVVAITQEVGEVADEAHRNDRSSWEPKPPENPRHNQRWFDTTDGNLMRVWIDHGEHPRINYALNPNFAEGTDNWTLSGGDLTWVGGHDPHADLVVASDGATLVLEEVQGRTVTLELEATDDDDEGEGGSEQSFVGVPWSVTAHLTAVSDNLDATAVLEVIDTNDNVLASSGPIVLPVEQMIVVQAPSVVEEHEIVDAKVRLTITNVDEGDFVSLDKVMLEPITEPEEDYFDGDMPGVEWETLPQGRVSVWSGEPDWYVLQDDNLKQELYDELEGLDADLTDLHETVLPYLRDRLDTLRDETLPALDARVQEAEDILGPMPGRLEAAEQAVADAESAASQAATDAAAALTTAADAEQAALDAAGIAEGKGQVITQVSAPTGSRARAENLWVRLPDHKVHIYDGGQWVAATDPDLITAAGEAAQALQDAADAATAAQDAATAAQDAQDRAEALEGQVGTLQDDLAAAEAEIATVRDTTIPALNADLATLRDTTVPNLEAIVGPLPQQIADAQAAADDAQAEAETKASTEWVLSRGTDLVTNGTGYMGDNTNFSTFDEYDPTDAPTGARGSFVIVSDSRPSGRMIDEHLPVTPSRRYLLSIMAREQNPDTQGESRFYVGLVPYDAQGVQIGPQSYSHDPLTMTVLTAPLNPGDTTVTVESTENFGRLSASSYVGIWGWTDPDGRTWEPGTYTRDYPRIESIVGNVIHLESPFQGAPRPVGTPVSNNRAGGTYMYAVSNKYASLEWERATGVFGGIHDTTNGAATRSFPPATASVKIVWLSNYQGATGSRQAFSAVSFSDATAALAEAEAAQAAADAAQADVDALEGQVGTLQTALGEAEDAVDELRDVTLPGLNTRLDDVEYDQRNFSAEWITAGTLDTDRLNANAVAAAVASFLELHANQITAGLIQGSQINAESIAGAVASFLELNANQITAGEIGADRINVNDLAAAVATVITLNADRITSGEIGAARINTTELAVALATILSLDAGRITSGTIDTDRLNASEIGAAVGEFVSLSADQITAVGAGFNSVVANRMFADIFATNSITAEEADLGSIAADEAFIAALTAAIVTADLFVGREFTGGTFTGTTFRTATSGKRAVLDGANGLRLWNSDGGISLETVEEGLRILGSLWLQVDGVQSLVGAFPHDFIDWDGPQLLPGLKFTGANGQEAWVAGVRSQSTGLLHVRIRGPRQEGGGGPVPAMMTVGTTSTVITGSGGNDAPFVQATPTYTVARGPGDETAPRMQVAGASVIARGPGDAATAPRMQVTESAALFRGPGPVDTAAGVFIDGQTLKIRGGLRGFAARYFLAAPQDIPNQDWTSLHLTVPLFSQGIERPSSTMFEIPPGAAGVYQLTGQVRFGGGGTGQRYARWLKNGNENLGDMAFAPTPGAGYVYVNPSFPVELDEGDYVEFQAYQNSGSTMPAAGGSAQQSYGAVSRTGI